MGLPVKHHHHHHVLRTVQRDPFTFNCVRVSHLTASTAWMQSSRTRWTKPPLQNSSCLCGQALLSSGGRCLQQCLQPRQADDRPPAGAASSSRASSRQQAAKAGSRAKPGAAMAGLRMVLIISEMHSETRAYLSAVSATCLHLPPPLPAKGRREVVTGSRLMGRPAAIGRRLRVAVAGYGETKNR